MNATAAYRMIVGASLPVLIVLASTCGGGGSHGNSVAPPSSGGNVQPIVVNSGPAQDYANGLFTSVTVCVPSSSNCQTINGILVDTGSYGLRLLSSAGGGALTLPLPTQSGANGGSIGECAAFVSGFTWGSVKSADVQIAKEQASNVPIQVIDPTFVSIPTACKAGGVPAQETLQTLGANGILGVGPYAQDCGSACTVSGSSNPGMYYTCASGSCQVTTESLTQQLQNPVSMFAGDNNGVIIELPAASAPSATLSGSMVFGIGTQSNNGLGSASVFPLDGNGEFSTSFKGQSYPAFVDSGSNGLFFLDSNTSGLATCGDNSSFYCPASTANLSATTTASGTSTTINFTVGNADTLFSNRTAFVFPTLAGPNTGTFDWGLPFFLGRNVFNAIESHKTPAGVGPYWAY